MKDLVFEVATGPTVGSASSTPSPYLNSNPRLGAGSKSKPDSNLELTAKIPSCFPSGNSILVIVSCVYVPQLHLVDDNGQLGIPFPLHYSTK